MRIKLIHILWAFFLSVLLLVLLMFIAIWCGWLGYVPNVEQLDRPIDRFASQVISSDGRK